MYVIVVFIDFYRLSFFVGYSSTKPAHCTLYKGNYYVLEFVCLECSCKLKGSLEKLHVTYDKLPDSPFQDLIPLIFFNINFQ